MTVCSQDILGVHDCIGSSLDGLHHTSNFVNITIPSKIELIEAEKCLATLIIRFLHVRQPLLRGTPTISGGGLRSLIATGLSFGPNLLTESISDCWLCSPLFLRMKIKMLTTMPVARSTFEVEDIAS